MLKYFVSLHGPRVAGTLVTGVVGVGGYEQANTKLADSVADSRDAADWRSYQKHIYGRVEAGRLGHHNLGPEPQCPSYEANHRRREMANSCI